MSDKSSVAPERCPHLSNLVPELWDLLGEQEREQLLIAVSFYLFKKGEVIYEAGTSPMYCYILAKGQVKVCKSGVGDKSQILRMIRPDDFFGYQSYFASQPHTSSAIAIDRSIVCMVPIQILENIILSNPKVGLFFIQRISRKLYETDRLTISLAQKHTRGRLAEALLMLRGKYGLEQDNATISIYLSRQELANLSNMTTSNAIRTLYSFEEEHAIALDGRKIKILNEEKLRAISKMG
ncbi:Crp/Fnr family transcriptional regulator [Porphyromonas sp.]|uniref:Crp/Fnr family transcriptional regulator n=1 Tax=Porphyromonas sp. TaxID=1924944 RepID=UPI0026DAC7C3|nr:Crp/Fnr family transcriptional regulator [Porphyromonas sp.]MDO4771648.1 Crp/Fnr family transcriptional regulator [Porphyromonas sp.]